MDNNIKQLVENCITTGKRYGYLSWDGMLDEIETDDSNIISQVSSCLEQLNNKGELEFELDF
jgi:hypothetical protein